MKAGPRAFRPGASGGGSEEIEAGLPEPADRLTVLDFGDVEEGHSM